MTTKTSFDRNGNAIDMTVPDDEDHMLKVREWITRGDNDAMIHAVEAWRCGEMDEKFPPYGAERIVKAESDDQIDIYWWEWGGAFVAHEPGLGATDITDAMIAAYERA